MKLLDISENTGKYTITLYEVISETAVSLETPFFVVGATARDIILKKCFNVKPFRATEDIDLGVQVKDWEEFWALKKGLLDTVQVAQPRRLG